MRTRKIDFFEKLGNERIKEKKSLLENDIFFKYALENNYFTTTSKDDELKFYNEHIEKLTNYLITSGVEEKEIEIFKNECLKKTIIFFKNKKKVEKNEE